MKRLTVIPLVALAACVGEVSEPPTAPVAEAWAPPMSTFGVLAFETPDGYVIPDASPGPCGTAADSKPCAPTALTATADVTDGVTYGWTWATPALDPEQFSLIIFEEGVTAQPAFSRGVPFATGDPDDKTFVWTPSLGYDPNKRYVAFVNATNVVVDTIPASTDPVTMIVTPEQYVSVILSGDFARFTPLTPSTPPARAPVITATSMDNDITVSWNAVDQYSRYEVERQDLDDSTMWSSLATEQLTSPYLDHKVGWSLQRCYRVAAYTGGGREVSAPACATTRCVMPLVTGFGATSLSALGNRLRWELPTQFEGCMFTKFEIDVVQKGGGESFAQVNPTDYTYLHGTEESCLSQRGYCRPLTAADSVVTYKIRTIALENEPSGWSDEVTVRRGSSDRPTEPRNFSIMVARDSAILTWSWPAIPADTTAATYNVRYRTLPSAGFGNVASVSTNRVAYAMTDLGPVTRTETSYRFEVRTVYGGLTSGWVGFEFTTGTVPTVVLPPPPPPPPPATGSCTGQSSGTIHCRRPWPPELRGDTIAHTANNDGASVAWDAPGYAGTNSAGGAATYTGMTAETQLCPIKWVWDGGGKWERIVVSVDEDGDDVYCYPRRPGISVNVASSFSGEIDGFYAHFTAVAHNDAGMNSPAARITTQLAKGN
jgi:hypothetical protein